MDAIVANDNARELIPGRGPGTPLLEAWQVSQITRRGNLERHVLSNCSLSLHRGELVGIHGPAGSGRSELMAILAGFESPTRGVVMFEDGPLIDPFGGPEAARRRRRIGHLFATGMLLPALSARANVRVVLDGLHRPGMNEANMRDRVAQALDRSGFAGDVDAPAATLDRLQRVQAGLATSLVKDPMVLLCDAAADGLDAADATVLLQTFDTLRRTLGLAIVHATADAGLAQRASKTYRLRHGRLEPIRATSAQD